MVREGLKEKAKADSATASLAPVMKVLKDLDEAPSSITAEDLATLKIKFSSLVKARPTWAA
eukprot:15083235-Alexandrium_andersonii.AAC.1